ncbi:hypothetical protein SAMN05444156_2417 [Verrucomicrobium sp. GAS474]|uniref:hypothetical protein n=1 Tax=Verrucomicrobium sp. GAS474 TaxID=1882831 RepID=UPI00087A5277|nr:hypothetical protein [Verrucomicrobium sp. GAS474]SDU17552.1 hypothetical protein SAMN05444156_2417 [Verrucomicrobium sp. GAS474]
METNDSPAADPIFALSGTILKATETKDYALWCSVVNEHVKAAIPQAHFETVSESLGSYLRSSEAGCTYMGPLRHEGHDVHFWKISAPGTRSDLLFRMAVKDGLVSGVLFSSPFSGAAEKKK